MLSNMIQITDITNGDTIELPSFLLVNEQHISDLCFLWHHSPIKIANNIITNKITMVTAITPIVIIIIWQKLIIMITEMCLTHNN